MNRFCVGLLVTVCLTVTSVDGIFENLTFRQQKLARVFYLYNIIGGAQGILEKADYEAISYCALNISDYNKYTYEYMRDNITLRAFNAFPKVPMDRTTFLTVTGETTLLDPDDIAVIAYIIWDFWNYIAKTIGGVVGVSHYEFSGLFQCLKIDPSTVPTAFQVADLNNDGILSKEEYINTTIKFFNSYDEDDPSKDFFGGLTPCY